MKSKKGQQRPEQWYTRPVMALPLMYVLSVLIRYACAYSFSAGATVYIDEGLYINIARSLFSQGLVMYRAQPVSYVYLLYPLSILPAFLLPSTANVYRAVQLWNSLMISSIVFPAYILGRKLKLRREHALLVSGAALLIPELSLSMFLVAESLIYPVMLWLFVAGLTVAERPDRFLRAVGFGALAGMTYFLKPECIVFGICFLVVWLIYGFKLRQGIRKLQALTGFVSMGAVVLLGYWAYGLLFGKTTAWNLYEKQIPIVDFENIMIMFQGTLFHLFAFLVSAGGAFLLLPAFGFSKMEEDLRIFYTSILMALLAMCVSVGILVVPFNYTGSWGRTPTHLRYFAYFLPAFLAGLFLPELQGIRPRKGQLIVMLVLSVLFIFPSAFRCFSTQAGNFDSPGLNVFNAHRIGYVPGILLILAITAVNAYGIWALSKRGFTAPLQKLTIIAAVLFMISNGVAAYNNSISIDRDFEREVAQEASEIAGQDVLIVTNNLYDDFRGYQLDGHLHSPAQMVVVNNMLLDAIESEGVYRPFIPLTQAPNTENLPTIDTDLMLFDVTVADYVEFTDSVQTSNSATGLYTLARITPDQPYLKTALASMDGYVLHHGDAGSLLVFDSDMLARGWVTLHISMRTTSPGTTVVFSSEGQSVTVEPTQQMQTFDVTLPMTANGFFRFTITPSADLIIGGYTTE